MSISGIYNEADGYARRFKTRNPYELLDAIGAITVFSDEYEPDGLKGFSTILGRVMFAVINSKLNEQDRRIVAGHEAAHLILHKREILLSPAKAMKDFNLFDNSGRYEHQANNFLADFLVADDEVMDIIRSNELDYFGTARELCMPPPLLAFKLYSMMQRGFAVRNPVNLTSDFLGKSGIWE